MPAKSYAWSTILSAAVADGATIDIQTPGFDDPEYYDTDNCGLTIDGTVLTPEAASAAWASDFSSVTVTNSSGDDWAPAQTLYVTVAGQTPTTGTISDRLDAHDEQIAGLNTEMDDLESRVAALESAGGAVSLHDTDPKKKGHDEGAEQDEEHSRHKGPRKKR